MATKKGVEAGRAFVSLFTDDSALIKGLKAAREKTADFVGGTGKILKGFGSHLASYGSKIVDFGTVAATSIAAVIGATSSGIKRLLGFGKTQQNKDHSASGVSKTAGPFSPSIEIDFKSMTGSGSRSSNAMFSMFGGGAFAGNMGPGGQGGGPGNAIIPYGQGGGPGNAIVPYGQGGGPAGPGGPGGSAAGSFFQGGQFQASQAAAAAMSGTMLKLKIGTKDTAKEAENLDKNMAKTARRMFNFSGIIKGITPILSGVSKGFRTFFDGIARGLKATGDKFKNFGARVMAFGGIITGAALKSSKDFADVGDGISKMSDRTGASVKFLSELGYAARMSGADIAAVESALMGIRDKVMSQSDDIKLLGLDPRAMRFQSIEEQFNTLLSALSQVDDAQRRATLGASIPALSPTFLTCRASGDKVGP